MRYRLLVADIDGTLINAAREITAPVRGAVAAAQARGVRVCLATGRIWPSARRYVEALGADPPAILYNGGMVYDFAGGAVLARTPLPAPQALDVLRILRRHPAVQPHLYVGEGVYIPRPHPYTDAYQHKDSLEAEVVGDLAAWLEGDPARVPMKILNIGERPAIEAVAREIDLLPEPVNYVFSEATYLEILPPGVNKGAALRAAAASMGIPREAIIAVGDNLNDLEMIEFAGLGVAMANAPAPLRARADFVAPSNDDHGLKEVIDRFVLVPAEAARSERAQPHPEGGER